MNGEGRPGNAGGENRPGEVSGADRLADISAALLVGGASRRMGTDKAALTIDGEPLAVRTARLLAELFREVLWVGAPGPAPGPANPPALGPADAPGPADPPAAVRFVADPPGPRCALRGVVAALEAACTPRVLICATDMPALGAPLLLALTALPEAEIVLPRTERSQPLCALYRCEPMLRRARTHLAEGRLKLEALVDASRAVWLEGAELEAVGGEAALANLNTPQEWRRFRARQHAGAAPG